jgi:hypothetical protein
MAAWTGVVLALGGVGSDGLRSRLSTYLHPLAGRPLAWHAVQAVGALAPGRVCVAAGPELGGEHFGDLPGGARVVPGDPGGADALLAVGAGERVLVVDALAPTVGVALPALLEHEGDALLEGEAGEVLAGWLTAAGAAALVEGGLALEALSASLPDIPRVRDPRVFAVRSRGALARAAAAVRDRVVRRLMGEGVTFLLPETVLVDVGVTIGQDSVVYPGAVIEGDTAIGAETVVGPCCRIVASRIGSGVELKGFNYISHTTIRNRAILEAYVRRGYDE